MVGKVQTVLGAIAPEALGVTMTHEHLLCDLSALVRVPVEASRRAKLYAPVTMDLLGAINYGGQPNLDNARLLDVPTAIEETQLYRLAGGGAIVEATSIGIGRDPEGLRQIARATGLHIVMGGSFYVGAAHPSDMSETPEDVLVEGIVRDVTDGVGQSGVRSGVIGEVGCSWPLTAGERKVLRASGRAQRRTGAPLLIHPGRDERAPEEIVGILRDVGADISRTIVGHIDRTIFNRAVLKRLAATGCVLEFDLFGREYSYYKYADHIDLPNDGERLRVIRWLVDEGYGNQIVVAHDTASKSHLIRYGGCGYAHIVQNIVPRMRRRGLVEEHIQAMLVSTPARLLAFAEPQRGA